MQNMERTTTSQNEVKKVMMKTQTNLSTTSAATKNRSMYKTVIKPGGISSQSFVQVPENLVRTTMHLGQMRFNS